MIFTGGTVFYSGRTDVFTTTIGIKSIDPSSREFLSDDFGSADVFTTDVEISLENQAKLIAAAPKPAIVLTTSHDCSKAIYEALTLLDCKNVVARAVDEPMGEALDRLWLSSDDGVFVSAGAWSGLDVPHIRFKSVIIPKTPYGVPTCLDGEYVTHFFDSHLVAFRRTTQGFYRGLRTPDASCTLLLLDPRSGTKSMLKALPARFAYLAKKMESFDF